MPEKSKKQPYLQRALNTFGAKVTGRTDQVAADKEGHKYLTEEEIDRGFRQRKRKKGSAAEVLGD